MRRFVRVVRSWSPVLSWEAAPGASRVRQAIKPIYLFESTIRTWLVHAPRVLSKRFPSFNRTISLLFMYMMFQVLAILGAFLLNAICSVTLDISGLAAKHAFDFSLNRSIAHGFATFYVTYSTIRVFVRFGQAIGVIAWESLDDFPDARKIVNHATSQWPMFIFIVFIPQCLMALSLVGTPWLCKGVAVPERVGGVFHGDPGLSQAFPFHLKWQSFLEAARQDGVADRLQSFVCVRTPLLYLTRPYPSPRRTMSAVLVVGLVQYVQILLHRFPNWRADMRPSGKKGRLCVHFSLLACLTLTGRWLVGWMFLQLGLDLAGQVLEEWVRDLGCFGEFLLGVWRLTFRGMGDIQESGLYIILAWTLWVVMIAYVLCRNASSAVPKDRELRSFFQNLKTSFIVAVTFFFLRGCASPTMGFIQAQQELTILTIVIPILYVALYTTVNAALQMSVGLVVVGGPVAMFVSVKLCQSSGFGGPGTFVVVFLHMFIKLLQLFGDDDFADSERDGYDEDDARGRPSVSAPGTPRVSGSPRVLPSLPPYPTIAVAADVAVAAAAAAAAVDNGNGGVEGEADGGSDDDLSSCEAEEEGGAGGDADGSHAAGGGVDADRGRATPSERSRRGMTPTAAAAPPRGRKSLDHGGDDGDTTRTSEEFRLPPPTVARHQPPLGQQEQDTEGRGGAATAAARKSRASSASPSFLSASARRQFNPIHASLLPSSAVSGVPSTGGGGSGDGRTSGSVEQRQRQRPPVRSWKSERPLYRRSMSGTRGGREDSETSDPAVRDGRNASLSGLGDVKGGDGIGGATDWGQFGGGGAGGRYEPGWQYTGAKEGGGEGGDGSTEPSCKRRMRRRCLSVDDLQFLSSRRRNEEWTADWEHLTGRRNTFDHKGVGNGRSAAGEGGNEQNGGPRLGRSTSGDTAKRNGTQGTADGLDSNNYYEPHYLRPAWMRSGVASGVASSLAAAMETNSNAQFVFKGTMRGGCALLAILSLFLASCQIISLLQEQHEWYPSLIKYSVTDSKQLVVDNAFVVKATLETTGDPVIVPPKYASCGSKWHGLSLLDYALLAELAYFDQHDDKVPLSEVAKQFFPPGKHGPDFKIKVKQGDDLHSHAQFFEAYSAKLNVSVVAIRGTDVGRISDLIEDIKIWVEPIVLKGLSMVFPTIRIWPDSTSSVVIEWLHETLQLFGLQQQAHYYRPLLEYVRAIEGRNVVLTGHSLGGGLARIVGALEKATSICFSPPGIAQSYRKFSVGAGALDRALLHQMSVSIIPEYDFVPMIDTQVGLIQLISCDTAGKALQLSCHMLEGTICDIIRHCGDDRGRFTNCKFEYNMSHLVPQMLILLQGRWVWIGALLLLTGVAAMLLFVSEFVTYTKSSLPLLDEPGKMMVQS